ncbi:MAG: DoxX family protein [Candidatus Limnocylindrales bacterium]
MATVRRHAPDVLAALFAVSGVLHLVRPAMFDALIPPFLPAPGAIIGASGVAELICAAALTRRLPWAGPASAALLVAVFPGNVWFAIDPAPSRSDLVTGAAWLRLPVQAALVWAGLQARKRPVDITRDPGQTPNDR